MIEKMIDDRNKELKKPTCWTSSQRRGLGCGMAHITSNRPCQPTWLSLPYVTLRLWINLHQLFVLFNSVDSVLQVLAS